MSGLESKNLNIGDSLVIIRETPGFHARGWKVGDVLKYLGNVDKDSSKMPAWNALVADRFFYTKDKKGNCTTAPYYSVETYVTLPTRRVRRKTVVKERVKLRRRRKL